MRVRRASARSTGLVRAALLCVSLVGVALALGCDLNRSAPLITVYSPALQVSFPLPQGWTADEARQQSGFNMQIFTGASVDVPERPGIRVQILAGPMPSGTVADVATRFQGELEATSESPYRIAGAEGTEWRYLSDDGEESSRLMLVDLRGTLYGLFVRGEARTLEAYGPILDQMFDEFAIERSEYFDAYEAPGGDVVIRHPRSWERTQTVANPPESLFVGFRSTPLAVEREGTTVHATLEVTVNKIAADVTVESFYLQRTEQLGDNYRLVRHETLEDVGAISTLYFVETQLADYLERTVYFVRDGKSFIFKFNARSQVFYAIEDWIDEMVRGFFGAPTES